MSKKELTIDYCPNCGDITSLIFPFDKASKYCIFCGVERKIAEIIIKDGKLVKADVQIGKNQRIK